MPLAALALLLATPARAGGYFYSDSGVVALGRSGAWVAGANTQFAQYYNPAGIIHVEDPTLNVGWSGIQQNVAFDRASVDDPSTPEVESFPTARNLASPFDVPELGFATPLIRERLAFAFGFTSPYAPSSRYDADGPQRYTIIDTSIYQFAITPTLAWRPVKYVTIGASFEWKYLDVGESLKVTTAFVAAGMDDPDNDVLVSIKAADRFTPNANIGLLIDPIEQLTIGLALEPPTHFHAKGTGILDFTGNTFEPLLDQSVYEDDDVHLNIAIPLVLRAGIAVRPVHPLELEAALVYQKWSALESIQIEDVNVDLKFNNPALSKIGSVPTEFTLPAGLDDTMSYRLGAEWRAIPELALRTGGFYETGSLSPKNVSVALYDPDKWQISGGASAFLLDQRLRFDAAFAWLHFDTLAVKDSTVTQVNALDGPTGIVGNGAYRSHGWVVGLAGSWTFKHHQRPAPDAGPLTASR